MSHIPTIIDPGFLIAKLTSISVWFLIRSTWQISWSWKPKNHQKQGTLVEKSGMLLKKPSFRLDIIEIVQRKPWYLDHFSLVVNR